MIDAISAPIDKKFDYTKQQDIKRYETYDPKLFYYAGYPIKCKEFLQ